MIASMNIFDKICIYMLIIVFLIIIGIRTDKCDSFVLIIMKKANKTCLSGYLERIYV